jgi:hypothetical protein
MTSLDLALPPRIRGPIHQRTYPLHQLCIYQQNAIGQGEPDILGVRWWDLHTGHLTLAETRPPPWDFAQQPLGRELSSPALGSCQDMGAPPGLGQIVGGGLLRSFQRQRS